MEEKEKMYWAAIQNEMPGNTFTIINQMVTHYGSVQQFWRTNDTVRLPRLSVTVRERLMALRKEVSPEKQWEICIKKKVSAISCIEEDYPKELLPFANCPVILYYYGNKQFMQKAAAGIVGSRRCTAYGCKMAADFARVFSEAGCCIVSGMAKGIDTSAHEGALLAMGGTIAVLGCGVDIPYPPENRKLYWRIREEGLVISEFLPGTKPLQWHFPLRNRIISGLSRFVLVVEGQARSGAIITCDWAAEQGKEVWAIPGALTNPFSIGPLQLIRDGARVAITPQEILKTCMPESGFVGIEGGAAQAGEIRRFDRKKAASDPGQQVLRMTGGEANAVLSAPEKKLYENISYYPVHIDSLLSWHSSCNEQTKSEGNLYLDLTKLLALRLIEKLPGDYYQRI